MKLNRYASVVLLLSVLTFAATASMAAERGKKKAGSGGQADSHMSGKGSANTNAQWTADPERGWIRTDERHDRQSQGQPTKPKDNRSKPRGQDKR